MKSKENKRSNRGQAQKTNPIFLLSVFGAIFLFFLVHVFVLLNHSAVEAYNVGVASYDNVATTREGILIRDENRLVTENEGYIHFFVPDGTWISEDSLAVTSDKEGTILEKVRSLYYGKNILSKDSRTKIQKKLLQYIADYDSLQLSDVDGYYSQLESTVLLSLIKDGGKELTDYFSQEDYEILYSENDGFFLTWFDGLEDIDVEELSEQDFRNKVSPMRRTSGEYLKAGENAAKIAVSNAFRICFPMSETEASLYPPGKNMTLRMEDGLEITGVFSRTQTKEGSPLGVVSFKKYGANYLTKRYYTFQILDKEVYGFKIPESAIVEKNMFVVPKNCICTVSDGNKSETGVLVYSENQTQHFLAATVYTASTGTERDFVQGEEVAYIYSEQLTQGTQIQCTDPESPGGLYTLGTMTSVEGCYQINNGYCIFRPIVRVKNSLDTSYVVIYTNVVSGLRAYDRIVLNAEEFNENEIIFQ